MVLDLQDRFSPQWISPGTAVKPLTDSRAIWNVVEIKGVFPNLTSASPIFQAFIRFTGHSIPHSGD